MNVRQCNDSRSGVEVGTSGHYISDLSDVKNKSLLNNLIVEEHLALDNFKWQNNSVLKALSRLFLPFWGHVCSKSFLMYLKPYTKFSY